MRVARESVDVADAGRGFERPARVRDRRAQSRCCRCRGSSSASRSSKAGSSGAMSSPRVWPISATSTVRGSVQAATTHRNRGRAPDDQVPQGYQRRGAALEPDARGGYDLRPLICGRESAIVRGFIDCWPAFRVESQEVVGSDYSSNPANASANSPDGCSRMKA